MTGMNTFVMIIINISFVIHQLKKNFGGYMKSKLLLIMTLLLILFSACASPIQSSPTAEPIIEYIVVTATPNVVSMLPTSTTEPTSEPTPEPTITEIPTAVPTETPFVIEQQSHVGVIFTDGLSLYTMGSDGKEINQINSGLQQDFEYVFYDSVNMNIYVSTWDSTIQLVHQAGSPKPDQLNLGKLNYGGHGGQGFAVDPGTGKVFYGQYYGGVFVKDMHRETSWAWIVTPQALSPLLGQRGQLQIDPENQHVYFRTAFNGDCGECRWIYRVDYDGKNLTKITKANGGDALALDLDAGKMYYSDFPGDNTIKRANLNGSGVEMLFRIPAEYGFVRNIAVDTANQQLYFYLYEHHDAKVHAIARSQQEGSDFEVIYKAKSGIQMMGGLALVSAPPVCGDGWSRLEIGKFSSVIATNPIPNRVREEPHGDSKVIGGLPVGSMFKIIDGPVCASGYVFWKVESDHIPSGFGWTAEGDGKDYYLTSTHLILTTPTEFTSKIFIQNNRYILQVTADRILPEPKQLKGGGKIDFIWFIDADMNKNTGQSHHGNDYNIHLTIDEFGWSAYVFPVSHVALTNIVQINSDKIKYSVDGLSAEISFPTMFLPQKNFSWWMVAVSHNSSSEWEKKLPFPVSLSEQVFTVD